MRYDMNIDKGPLGNTELPTKPAQRCAGFVLCTRCDLLNAGAGTALYTTLVGTARRYAEQHLGRDFVLARFESQLQSLVRD